VKPALVYPEAGHLLLENRGEEEKPLKGLIKRVQDKGDNLFKERKLSKKKKLAFCIGRVKERGLGRKGTRLLKPGRGLLGVGG